MFLMGPGIRQGIEVDTPFHLADLSRTVAWLLDLDLDMSTGRVMWDLLVDEVSDAGKPTGQIAPALAGGVIPCCARSSSKATPSSDALAPVDSGRGTTPRSRAAEYLISACNERTAAGSV